MDSHFVNRSLVCKLRAPDCTIAQMELMARGLDRYEVNPQGLRPSDYLVDCGWRSHVFALLICLYVSESQHNR